MFPQAIAEYVKNEVKLGAAPGPFSIPPFVCRMGVSPLSTRPKRESGKRRVILDLSFPLRSSVNDGIKKTHYCGEEIKLTYPTINTLAKRIATLVSQGKTVLIWKKDLLRAFRQVFLCLRDYSLIGYRWRNLLYFDKVVPMGLRSAAYICQQVTNAIVYAHNTFGCWSINYLDDFGSAEDSSTAWFSYNMLSRIFDRIGVKEALDKAVPPTTRMDFLGNTVDSEKLTLEVSQDRKQELMHLLKKWVVKQYCTKKQLQSLIGKLSFITNCVQAGKIFISRMIQNLCDMPETGYVKVNEQTIKDVKWWIKFLPTFDGVSILWLQDMMPIDNR